MEQIIIQVKDSRKARALVDFLQTLDFIESVDKSGRVIAKKAKQTQSADFFALAGLWAGRDITLNAIRQKGWPGQA